MGMIETAIAAARAAGDILRTQYGMLLTRRPQPAIAIAIAINRGTGILPVR